MHNKKQKDGKGTRNNRRHNYSRFYFLRIHHADEAPNAEYFLSKNKTIGNDHWGLTGSFKPHGAVPAAPRSKMKTCTIALIGSSRYSGVV